MKTIVKDTRNAIRIGVTCFLAYLSCYLGKNLLSAMMPQLLESGVFDDISLGRMASVFMLTYGAGQLINGVIGNRIRGRYMIAVGLLFPGILMFVFPHCTAATGVILWGVCGFFSSMLWGPISRMIGENTKPAAGEILMTLMTVASSLGSLGTQALAVVGGITGKYIIAFYISGSLLCLISLSLFLYTLHLERIGVVQSNCRKENKHETNGSRGLAFLSWGFVFMLILTMLNGVVRNAVSFWIPTFFVQYLGFSTELAAGVMMILPFVNIAGPFFALWLMRVTKRDEIQVCLWLFLLSVPLFAVLFWCRGAFSFLSVAALFLASAAMMGVCNLVFSVYVLRYRDTGKLSGISGFFDFSSYISASAGSLLFTELMAGNNWNGLIFGWVLIGVLGALFAFFSSKCNRKI